MTRFYQDRYKQIFEEEEANPGRLRGVTDLAGDRYISETTVSKKHWEDVRGPLVEVPNPWIPNAVKVYRIEDVVARWEDPNHRPNGSGVSHLLAELKVALGHQLKQEDP